MTDGIIQKTIDKYRKKTFITKHAKFEVLELKDLNKLQQELIEKIKEAHATRPYYQLDNGVKVYTDILTILIGDNQE